MLNPSSRIKVPADSVSSLVWARWKTNRSSLCVCAGGEGLAEIRDGPAAEEVRGSHPYAVQRGLEVQGDADQAESRGSVLHRQGEWVCPMN